MWWHVGYKTVGPSESGCARLECVPFVSHADISMSKLDPESPIVAGRYRVDSVLGKGGMASVLRVHDYSSGRDLALKRLHGEARAKHVALFEREYHTLAGLTHPHVVKVFEYASDAAGPFYTMELLGGEDLCRVTPRPWREVCSILRAVASALSLLHVRRLLHRDVSARNVIRTEEGMIKLIDFGTLCAFGTTSDVAGTPPFIAPEALYGQPLDQRSDLYALGALGYFLLTGAHAFPVRSLGELAEAWRTPPQPVAERVRALSRELEEPPPAVDALIDALLSSDPLARPGSTGELIGRLTAAASLPSDTQHAEVVGYLESQSFVGRARERDKLSRALNRLEDGKGQSFVIESGQGMGKTRLLNEIVLDARLSAGAVLSADALTRKTFLGTAEFLMLRLLEVCPDDARAALRPHAATLGHVSPRLCEQLELGPDELAAMPPTGGEARMRIQAALREGVRAFTERRSLVVLIDNAEDLDEGSAAWLATLAHDAKSTRLLLVSTLNREALGPLPLPIVALRQAATVLELEPLKKSETEELLGSVFGDAPHLARLSELVHEQAQGSPRRAMDLAEHLVREEVVRHADGVWLLPQAIATRHLPQGAHGVQAARLERLPAPARALARALSVHEGYLPLDLCAALSDSPPAELFGALEQLVAAGVLIGTAGGYRMRDQATRETLSGELPEAQRRRAHRIVGEHLLKRGEPTALVEITAGLHLLLGGDEQRGSGAAARAGKRITTSDHGAIAEAAPLLEACLGLLQSAGRSDHEIVAVLAPMVLAGYYQDRRYTAQYAETAIRTLSRILGLGLARRLRPFFGRRLGLLFALGWAAFGFRLRRNNPRVPTFRECMLLLFSCVAATCGVSAVCVDPRSARRFAEVLEPLTALGPNHAATLFHELCTNLATTVEDRLGEARWRWKKLIERLAKDVPVQDLPEHAKVFYHAGALYACGVLEAWRDDSRALAYAEQLERLGLKLYALNADQVRMLYYANQGDAVRMEHYRERVEMHAIQRGTAWQVDTWASGAQITVALRSHDALRMKHALEQLKELRREVPSLERVAERAEGAYFLLRHKTEAVEALSRVLAEEPLGTVGWARAHGTLARALNAVGEHERARETCLRALDHLSPEDLSFTAMNLGIEIELALAEAGLGKHALAAQNLDELIAAHRAGNGPLTLGALHEARARVALLAGEDELFRLHVAQMDRHYRGTTMPTLIERSERLSRDGRRSTGFAAFSGSGLHAPLTHDALLAQRMQLGGDASLHGSAQWVLAQLTEFAALREAYLYVARNDGTRCLAAVGEALDPQDLVSWVEERIEAGREREELTECAEETVSGRAGERDRLVSGGLPYRLMLLATSENSNAQVIGALVVPDQPPTELPQRALRAAADRLRAAASAQAAEV
jgi:tetratricopeptide (TPR) repeat protein